MRFRFCWDTDCPDWLLAEIVQLSSLPSATLQSLVSHIAGTIAGHVQLDREQLARWIPGNDQVKTAACVGGIRWILEKAAGAQVTSSLLDSELQQLGLPKQHSEVLTAVYSEQLSAMYATLRRNTGINCCGGDISFNVDVKGLELAGEVKPVAQLSFITNPQGSQFNGSSSGARPPSLDGGLGHEYLQGVDGVDHTNTVKKMCITSDQLNVLIQELCEARQIMASLT